MAKIVDAMVREANAANFTIHVINAKSRGMQAPQHDVENTSSGINLSAQNFFQRQRGNDPIDTTECDSIPLSVALGTGGMYLPSANLTESIQRIDTQTSNFYSLGYTPDAQRRPLVPHDQSQGETAERTSPIASATTICPRTTGSKRPCTRA